MKPFHIKYEDEMSNLSLYEAAPEMLDLLKKVADVLKTVIEAAKKLDKLIIDTIAKAEGEWNVG